jgi:hypothetical protein
LSEPAGWLSDAVSTFGVICADKLAGPGDKEAAIRSPLEGLLGAAGAALKVKAVFHDEVRDTERQVRPDYGVSVGGAITGYVEVKAPGRDIDPARLRGHDLRQWERQRDLPNLLYTNGTEWRLYRDSEPAGEPISFTGGPLDTAKSGLTAPAVFEAMITDFLRWEPAPITSVGALVRAVAPLTRLLRGEVLDQLATERRAIKAGDGEESQPFLGLARDWRALLFPTATDDVFADGYAQTVTFALLLARTENIDLTGVSLHGVGRQLGHDHSLMGKRCNSSRMTWLRISRSLSTSSSASSEPSTGTAFAKANATPTFTCTSTSSSFTTQCSARNPGRTTPRVKSWTTWCG